VQRSPTTGLQVLTSGFIQHVTNFDNWSVGGAFLDVFPELAGQIRIFDP